MRIYADLPFKNKWYFSLIYIKNGTREQRCIEDFQPVFIVCTSQDIGVRLIQCISILLFVY